MYCSPAMSLLTSLQQHGWGPLTSSQSTAPPIDPIIHCAPSWPPYSGHSIATMAAGSFATMATALMATAWGAEDSEGSHGNQSDPWLINSVCLMDALVSCMYSLLGWMDCLNLLHLCHPFEGSFSCCGESHRVTTGSQVLLSHGFGCCRCVLGFMSQDLWWRAV